MQSDDDEGSNTRRGAKRRAASPREISVTEIWLILLERRTLVLAVIVVSTLAGAALGLLRGERYTVSVAVEIGSVGAGGLPTPVEEAVETVAKLTESYIPQLLDEKPQLAGLNLTARSPTNSTLIKLSTEVVRTRTDEIAPILNDLADEIVQEHEQTIAEYRAAAKTQVEELSQQIGELNSNLQGLEKERMALQRALAESQGVELVPIALAHVEIERIIAGYRQSLAGFQRNLHAARDQLIVIQSSRRISPAIVSARPSGPGLGVITLLALFTGAVIALVVALCVEFVASAARYRPDTS